MTVEARIVARFGVSVTKENPLCVIELDEKMNLGADGTAKTEFDPPDVAWFLVHLDSGLYVASARTSAGSVQLLPEVTRDRGQDVEFTELTDEVTLPHNPVGAVTPTWDGRDGLLRRAGRVLTVQDAPAIGSIAYQLRATQCRFIPPKLDLTAEQQFKIRISLLIEERP